MNGKSRVVLPLYHGCLEPLSGGSPPPIYSLHRFILALQSSSFLSSTIVARDEKGEIGKAKHVTGVVDMKRLETAAEGGREKKEESL